MQIEPRHVNGWSQSALIPPDRVRIEVSIHLSASSHRAQMGVEVRDGLTDQILGLSTVSIDHSYDSDAIAQWAAEAIRMAVSEHYFPF